MEATSSCDRPASFCRPGFPCQDRGLVICASEIGVAVCYEPAWHALDVVCGRQTRRALIAVAVAWSRPLAKGGDELQPRSKEAAHKPLATDWFAHTALHDCA